MSSPAVSHVVVSRTFEDAVGPEGLAAYVEAIVETVHANPGGTSADLAPDLARRFESHGVQVHELEVRRMAEALARTNGQGLRISADDGRELYAEGFPDTVDADAVSPQPEPSDDDRPAYS